MLSLAIISTLVVFGELYFLLGLFLYQTDGKVHHSLVLLLSWVGWALLVFILVELLSMRRLLAPVPIYTAWGIIVLALFSIIPFLTPFERVGIINPADSWEKTPRFAYK
jgi:hypothetical protein